MTRWAGEMEFDFVDDGANTGGAFVVTSKAATFIRTHLARGEVEAAARLYEQTGGAIGAELLSDAQTASSTSQKGLAEMFVMARDFISAARAYEMGKRNADAARLYEQGGDFAAAAACFQKDGDLTRAGAALERAGKVSAALELYQRAGSDAAVAECLARAQRYFEAAQVYQRLGNVRGEAEMLRAVPMSDPNRVAAARRLSDLLEQYGRSEDAARLLADTVRQVPAAQTDPQLQTRLVRLLEATGRGEQAARLKTFIRGALPPAAQEPAQPVQVLPPPPPQPPLVPATPLGIAPSQRDPFDILDDPFKGSGGSGAQAPSADAYGFLKRIPIFGELPLQDMKDLYRLCSEFSCPPGSVLIEQGVRGIGLVIILDGAVQVLRVDANGVGAPLATIGPGNYVGEISLVDDAPTSARVVAQGMVRGLFLQREKFEHFLYSREAAALCIYRLFTRTLAERLRAANQRK